MNNKKYSVLWSGGADSTLALTMYASYSSTQVPIEALSVVGHKQLNEKQLINEKQARDNYLQWAKRQGYNIRHSTVKIDVNNIGVTAGDQSSLWLCHLSPYISKDETAIFSYIQGDIFWHSKHEFVTAFNALSALMSVERNILFPLEWYDKCDVLRDLEKWKVPEKCWWTCDGQEQKKNKPCGKCSKCEEIESAKKKLEKQASRNRIIKKNSDFKIEKSAIKHEKITY